VQELRLRPVLVLLPDETYAGLIRELVGHNCRILIGAKTDTSSFATSLSNVRVGLVDGSITSTRSGTLEGLGITRIYYTKRLQRKIYGWNNVQTLVRHEAVGGVTTMYALQCGLLSKVAAPWLGALAHVAPRDVSTVLSVMPPHHLLRSAPRCRHLGDAECCNLGTAHRPYYHGGGGSRVKSLRKRA
jgi:hypothetical protein